MLTLLTYPPNFGLLSASPFCVKAIYALNAAGVAWHREDTNDPRKMPLAKLPVLRTEDRLIAGSDQIAEFVAPGGWHMDRDLTKAQAATSHSLIRMVEEHLYVLLVLDRWERDAVWPHIRDAFFAEIPTLLRGPVTRAIRKSVLRGAQAQGLGRMAWPERMARAETDLNALEGTLGDKPFLFGGAPCSADWSVAPFLGAIAATPVETPLQARVAQDARLSAYVARVDAAFGDDGAQAAVSLSGGG